jgi:hypothetical protein
MKDIAKALGRVKRTVCSFGRRTRIVSIALAAAAVAAVASAGVSAASTADAPRYRLDEVNVGKSRERLALDGDEVRPETWRRLELSAPDGHGGVVEITLLRPLAWIREHRAFAGTEVDLQLDEFGVVGPSTVKSVGPCEVDARRPESGGRVETPDGPHIVTGSFRRTATEVIDLVFRDDAGRDETVGVTPNHRVWSRTRDAWIEAGTLERGEEVSSAAGGSVRVVGATARPRRAEVFNLEVQGAHAYRVGTARVLVHNGCPSEPAANAIQKLEGKSGTYKHSEEVVGLGGKKSVFYGSQQDAADAVNDAMAGATKHGWVEKGGSLRQTVDVGRVIGESTPTDGKFPIPTRLVELNYAPTANTFHGYPTTK